MGRVVLVNLKNKQIGFLFLPKNKKIPTIHGFPIEVTGSSPLIQQFESLISYWRQEVGLKAIPLCRLEAASFLSLSCPFGMIQPSEFTSKITIDRISKSTILSFRWNRTLDINALHTVGEDTRTYPFDPDASKAASFDDFSKGTLVKGVVFSGEGFGRAGAVGADSTMGLDGIGGGTVGEMAERGALTTPILRFKCISNSPTYSR